MGAGPDDVQAAGGRLRQAVRVEVDAGAAPRTLPWLQRAAHLCAGWYPQVAALLDTPGFAPPRTVTLRSVPTLGGAPGRAGTPGVTSGTVITVGADWLELHPDDTGLVLHELVHVVQSYPNPDPWWVTEGIADWVRYQRFETADPRARPDLAQRSYRDGYAVTAAFLAWVEATYAVALVTVLNTAMRRGAWSTTLVPATVGMSVDDLWARFVGDPRRVAATKG
ncbi:MAG TPA: basic secretory protein-like protein [Candidatus Dormibacteraeota bacterium]